MNGRNLPFCTFLPKIAPVSKTAIYCIVYIYLAQHIVVTLLSRSKTVVGFFPIAAICRVLPNKSQPEHVFYPLPWQTKRIRIILTGPFFQGTICPVLPHFAPGSVQVHTIQNSGPKPGSAAKRGKLRTSFVVKT